jgi:class 3 adenylate cyclase/tetratricopeptide (TPR) repeat protein/ribosomal protein L40E
MRCSKCGTNNPSTNSFCARCGNALTKLCARCKAENPPTSDFCGKCGAPLTIGVSTAVVASSTTESASGVRIAPEQPDASPTIDGERKTVTALFADIKGSMDLMEDIDPEEARAIVDPALKLMMDAAHRYDGYIVQSTGDGIFAMFGAPIAREDHPQRALLAALRMQEDLKRYADKLRERGRPPLSVRVGINTGEVVVRSIQTGDAHTEYTPIGHSMSLASRLQTLAAPGSVVIGASVQKFVEGYFQLKALGASRIKGVSDPVAVFEVTGLGPLRTRLQRAAGRGLTKFVGRQREIDAMKHAAEQAKAGHGQIAAAVAEAGTGKSRLLFEFKAVSQSGWMVLEAFSVSHGKASAYLPVIDLLQSYFKIAGEDDQRTRRAKVTGNVLTLDRSFEDTLPYLFAILGIDEGEDPLAGMDTQIRKRRTLEAIKRILLRESLNQPLMVIFEDLHWIDEETQALLNLLADSIGTAKVLLLVNYRPEYTHQWNSKTYYTQLRLDPLGREGADEMLTAMVGDGAEVHPLKRLIIERTGGNPFFMEETVQVLLDEGALMRDGAAFRLTKTLGELKIPPTVQAILAARIDRLPADEKDLLHTLAVIGNEFQLSLVRAVIVKSDDELNRMLGNLQLAEFIYEQPAVGDIEYRFKHALTQEVAYNSVLVERRRQLHERIASAIEQVFTSQIDDHVAELANHYRRAGNSAKAIDYLLLAAEQNISRNASNEATAGLRDGLTLLGGITDEAERAGREAALQLALANTLRVAGPAAPGVETAFLRARELCERSGDRGGLFAALLGLLVNYNFRAQHGRALELSEELSKIARHGEPSERLSAHASAVQTLYFLGDLSAARQHLEQVREMAAGDIRLGAPGLRELIPITELWSRRGQILCLLGYPDQAAHADREGIAHARQTRIPIAIAVSELFSAQLHYFIRDVRKARERSETALRLANEYGISQVSGYAASLMGWVEASEGDAAKGVKEIRRAMEVIDLAGSKLRTLLNAQLVECHLMHGDVEEGLVAAGDALAHVESAGERYCSSELNRLKGELLLRHEPSRQAAAESAFRTAIEVARAQQARWWELRATVSLARLLRDTGRRDQARTMLAEIYNWFTEGFDTADLKDAKALLEELSNEIA